MDRCLAKAVQVRTRVAASVTPVRAGIYDDGRGVALQKGRVLLREKRNASSLQDYIR